MFWLLFSHLANSETNLKLKQALGETQMFDSEADIEELEGTIECEQPNPNLYEFKGSLSMADERAPINVENVVWRGCKIMNTKFVFGLVVYTGQDTKLIRNSRVAPAKRSDVEKSVDRAIIIIFITLGVLCSICTALHARWLNKVNKNKQNKQNEIKQTNNPLFFSLFFF